VLGKTMEQDWGLLYYLGSVDVGVYYGLTPGLYLSSTGQTNSFGYMVAWASPNIPCPLIDHLQIVWDMMSGDNFTGATGAGLDINFSPTIDLLTGPVYYFDHIAAGVPDPWMWTAQCDIDVDFTKLFTPATNS